MGVPSTNWTDPTKVSTNWTGGSLNSSNWEESDKSAGILLLESSDDLLMETGNSFALQ